MTVEVTYIENVSRKVTVHKLGTTYSVENDHLFVLHQEDGRDMNIAVYQAKTWLQARVVDDED